MPSWGWIFELYPLPLLIASLNAFYSIPVGSITALVTIFPISRLLKHLSTWGAHVKRVYEIWITEVVYRHEKCALVA